MADPISLSSGLVAFVTFSIQTSISLYQIVKSFQNCPRKVRELKGELESLDVVLNTLLETINKNTDIDLLALKLPLLRCGKACREFEQVLSKCSAHSDESRTSFRDWARLKYMGDDITEFRATLAGYKSTINIALADATLRTSAVTPAVLDQYRDMIQETTIDLEHHLQSIEDKLQSISTDPVAESNGGPERQVIEEERLSTQQCLEICAQLSSHIDQIQLKPTGWFPYSISQVTTDISAEGMTGSTLREFREKLRYNIEKLQGHQRTIEDQLKTLSREDQDVTKFEMLQEEHKSISQCIDICAKASKVVAPKGTNVMEDVRIAEDGCQVVVSTFGELISAKHITAGRGSIQVVGQIHQELLSQLLRDHAHPVG